jgi:predicted double-glycine peptidase
MKLVRFPLAFILILLSAAIWPSFGSEKLPEQCKVDGVPYVKQLKNYCGPASLTCVLNYWGINTDQKTVGKDIFDTTLQATNGADMLLYARGKGLSSYSWDSNLTDIKKKLAQGIPVIVLQDSSVTDTSGHYRVATGYDDKRSVILVNDPYEPETKEMDQTKFQKLWDRHGNWSLLICPQNLDVFKQDLSDNNPVVHIDLAYIYYKHGDLESAERESKAALALEPANYSAKNLLMKTTNALGARGKTEKP